MPSGIKVKDINSKIKGGRVQLTSFTDSKSKQLNHYVKPILDVCEYGSAIIHVGMNNLL